MCSGDAQAEFDLRMIPAFSSFANSASAMRSFSGGRRRALANTGRCPPVSIVCSTPCVGVGVSVSDLIMEGYLASSCLTGSGMLSLTSCRCRAGGGSAAVPPVLGCLLTSLVGAAGAVAAAADRGGASLLTLCSCGAAGWAAAAVLRGRCLTSLVERGRLTSCAGAAGAVAAAADLGGVSLLTSCCGGLSAAAAKRVDRGFPALSNTWHCRGCMESWNFLKKSNPKIGVATLAKRKSWVYYCDPNVTVCF